MFTFLERYDLSGKRIIPFCTGATVEHGLSIWGCQAAKSEKKVSDWAKGLV